MSGSSITTKFFETLLLAEVDERFFGHAMDHSVDLGITGWTARHISKDEQRPLNSSTYPGPRIEVAADNAI